MTNMQQKGYAMLDTAKGKMGSNGGSYMEHCTRRERKFDLFESDLPDIKPNTASEKRTSLGLDALSSLGSWNPLPRRITERDTVWLFDNTAYRSTNSHSWKAEFVAAVFNQDSGVDVSKVVADIAGKLGIAKGDAAEATIRERLRPFVQQILPGRVVEIDFGVQKLKFSLGPGGRNAISSDLKSLPDRTRDEVATSVAKVPQGTDGILEMKTLYAEQEGWGVISDIDDTIKITQTSDPIGILKSTFVSPATPTKGMPELYAFLQQCVSDSAPFFYLSASPYNLYSFLSEFRQKHYPPGTMILRDASWMNLSGLLSNLTLGVQEYKTDRMIKINGWLPQRKMICVGDSTQSDPEAYGGIYRNYPGWVRLILIRKVTDIASIGIREKNEPKRFEKAFKDIPTSAWHVFDEDNPQECMKLIEDVVAQG